MTEATNILKMSEFTGVGRISGNFPCQKCGSLHATREFAQLCPSSDMLGEMVKQVKVGDEVEVLVNDVPVFGKVSRKVVADDGVCHTKTILVLDDNMIITSAVSVTSFPTPQLRVVGEGEERGFLPHFKPLNEMVPQIKDRLEKDCPKNLTGRFMPEFDLIEVPESMPEKKKFLFLAHWVENWNWLLWFIHSLHKKPENASRWSFLSPLYYLMSIFYALGRKSYDEVDNFKFGKIEGHTWLIRNFGWHFMIGRFRKTIQKRILDAILQAQAQGYSVIGLGALTKAEWLTAGGKWIVDELGDRLHTPIVHGDTLTAATVYHKAVELIEKMPVTSIFITGATSKIGRAVTLLLATKGYKVFMYSDSADRVNDIKSEAGKYAENIIHAKALSDGSGCLLWITGKSIPSGKKLLKYVPKGATLLNFSVPDPVTTTDLKGYDINHVEGGLLSYEHSNTTLHFTMRLRPGITYACHAGTMVHAYKGWKFHEVSHVDLDMIDETWNAAKELGFKLPS